MVCNYIKWDMCMRLIKRFLILALLLIAVPCWGANFYINPDWTGAESGTYDEPWNSFSDITGLSSGDDIYIKYGTTIHGELTIPVSGVSAANRTIVGCYDGNGDFDCTGKTLPIIYGYKTVSGGWTQHSGNVYYASVSNEVFSVFQDGDWVNLAWDSGGKYTIDCMDSTTGTTPTSCSTGTKNRETRFELPEDGDDMSYTEAQIIGADVLVNQQAWLRYRYRVESYTNNIITFYTDNQYDGSSAYTGASVDYWTPYNLFNKLLFLDDENEWFWCTAAHAARGECTANRLYLYQTGGGSPTGTITYSALGNGIEASGKDFLEIRELEISHFYLNGIYLYDCLDVIIGSSRVDGVHIHHIGSEKNLGDSEDSDFEGGGIVIEKSQYDNDFSSAKIEIQYTKINDITSMGIKGQYYANYYIHHNDIDDIGVYNSNMSEWMGTRVGQGIYVSGIWWESVSLGTISYNKKKHWVQ